MHIHGSCQTTEAPHSNLGYSARQPGCLVGGALWPPHLRTAGVIQVKVTVVILQMHAAERHLHRSLCSHDKEIKPAGLSTRHTSGNAHYTLRASHLQGLSVVLHLPVALLTPRKAILECRALSEAQLPLPRIHSAFIHQSSFEVLLRMHANLPFQA